MRITEGAFESRFGFRILAVFVASSVVPTLMLAALAYTSTRDQLEEDALAALRREAKAAAMSIVERISIGAADLELAALRADTAQEGSSKAFSRIDRVALWELRLSLAQEKHVRRGYPLLLSGGTERSGLRLLRARGEDVFVGLFSTDFLYTPERTSDDERYWVTDHTGAYLFGASADDDTRMWVAQAGPVEDRVPFEVGAADDEELAIVWPLFLKNTFLSPEVRIGISRSKRSIHRPLQNFRTNFAAALVLAMLGSVVIALHQIRIRVGPLKEILRATHEIERGNFNVRSGISSGDEFELLGSSVDAMAQKLGEDFGTLETLRSVADDLLDAPDRLTTAEIVIPAAFRISGANRGSLFVPDHSTDRSATRLIKVGDREAPTPTDTEAGDTASELAQRAFDSAETLFVIRPEEQTTPTWQALDDGAGKRVEAVYLVPLISGAGDPEGVFQLIFFDAPDQEIFMGAARRSLLILAAQAGAALKKIELIEDLRGLFEGVIRLTVDAIDEKSPYTGDHCRRVPVLTELVADAVCEDDEGPLKDFTLSESERYELKIAALLHDCGKVATPVHVMDKATKLETIIDCVELVRLRTEIIRRDLELEALRRTMAEHGLDSTTNESWSESHSRLVSDMRFIESCNIGGEFMDERHKQRIDEIFSRYVWVDQAGGDRPLLTDTDAMNLKISRGTLNDHEREIINNHVVTTIRLLDQLPFPPNMKNVPAIAGAHHEHVDGTGYPKGLAHDELSIQGRLLGLADVFEALTAKTRPYKPGKSLSETLYILEKMVEEGQLDRDLHEIFIRRKVYMQYAIEHMDPAQIDDPYREEFEEMSAGWDS